MLEHTPVGTVSLFAIAAFIGDLVQSRKSVDIPLTLEPAPTLTLLL
jgi:hypothetical protein